MKHVLKFETFLNEAAKSYLRGAATLNDKFEIFIENITRFIDATGRLKDMTLSDIDIDLKMMHAAQDQKNFNEVWKLRQKVVKTIMRAYYVIWDDTMNVVKSLEELAYRPYRYFDFFDSPMQELVDDLVIQIKTEKNSSKKKDLRKSFRDLTSSISEFPASQVYSYFEQFLWTRNMSQLAVILKELGYFTSGGFYSKYAPRPKDNVSGLRDFTGRRAYRIDFKPVQRALLGVVPMNQDVFDEYYDWLKKQKKSKKIIPLRRY